MNNLKSVPSDPYTRIISEEQVDIGDLSALLQQWAWEGIVAESDIFLDDDVSSFSDEELFAQV